jgi:hypothetical protein
MARYTLIHACGHESTAQLVGPREKRQRIIESRERGDCPECWRPKQRALPPEVTLRRAGDGQVEVIVTRSYEVREELRQRGYRYGEFSIEKNPGLFLGPVQKKGWLRAFPDADTARAEVQWALARGWPVSRRDVLT